MGRMQNTEGVHAPRDRKEAIKLRNGKPHHHEKGEEQDFLGRKKAFEAAQAVEELIGQEGEER